MYSSKSDLWETPQEIYDALDKEFGFMLDACALPENAKRYVERIEELTGVPIKIVAVGPRRDQTIIRGGLFE